MISRASSGVAGSIPKLADDADDPLDELDVVRQHAALIIQIVLEAHPHMAAEQKRQQGCIQAATDRWR